VIESSIRHGLAGTVELQYTVAGLHARLTIPAAHFRASAGLDPAIEVRTDHAMPAAVVPKDVLLVEDVMIIALDAEDMLRQLGVETVRIASGVGQALKEIGDRPPDFGLLDVNLGHETSFEIAERLTELGITFAFATGYGEHLVFPHRFEKAARLRKPYTVRALQEALVGAAASQGPGVH
jgi:CheY-like chemotaxis protein